MYKGVLFVFVHKHKGRSALHGFSDRSASVVTACRMDSCRNTPVRSQAWLWSPPNFIPSVYQTPSYWSEAYEAWSWPSICFQCKDYECVDLYVHFHPPFFIALSLSIWATLHLKLNQSLRVQGDWVSQISTQSANESGKVVSPTHRPPLPYWKNSWYLFLLGSESTAGSEFYRKRFYQRKIPVNGPGSVVGIATAYRLDGPGIKSRWRRDFPHLSRPALRPTQPPVKWVPGLFRG